MRKLKVLELFSGTGSISKAFEERGHKTVRIDWDEKMEADWHVDIGKLTAEKIVKRYGWFDVIWASPECTTYSVAAISKHRRKDPEWGGLVPISEYGKQCDRINVNLMRIIRDMQAPAVFIENPRAAFRKMDWIQWIPRHTVTYCLAGETRIVTFDGAKPISELADTSQKLLTSNGDWVEAPIRRFGVQPLMRVNLARFGKKKVVYATPNHLWMVEGKTVKTDELASGTLLDYAELKRQNLRIVDEWVARGFVFGDGWALRSGKKKAFAMFCGEKVEMLPYFKNVASWPWVQSMNNKPVLTVYDMPREWKTDIPSTYEDPSAIYSWLAGYFAADGSVGGPKGQVTISSSDENSLIRFRDLCRVVGIDTYPITTSERVGYGSEPSLLYCLTIPKDDLTEQFFLRIKHRKAFLDSKPQRRMTRRWKVVSVEQTDRVEPVYCAVVEKTHCFALEDGILTHNCQYQTELPLEQRRMKPTDIFCTVPNPKFKPPCQNGDPCHVKAPRGSTTGTQGMKLIDKFRIPDELCRHVVTICEDYISRLDKANEFLVNQGLEPITPHWGEDIEPTEPQQRLFS